MPKSLSEQQREWLDAALRSKGRFTRAKAVKKNWDDYVRRRDKAAAGSVGLLADDPQKKLVDDGLKRADALAKDGKFAEAYKSLDATKKIGAAASVERARAVSVDDLRVRLNMVRSTLGTCVSLCDFAAGHAEQFLARLATIESAGAKPTLREATLRLKEFAAEETVLLAELMGREQHVINASVTVRSANLVPVLAEIERDIAVHVAAGHRDLVQAHADRAAEYRVTLMSKVFYNDPDHNINLNRANRARYDTEMRRIKDIGKFRDIASVSAPDDKTATARKDLEGTPEFAWVEVDETDRVAEAKRLMAIAGYRDTALTRDTRNPEVKRSPELKSFDPDDVFDNVLADVFGTGGVPDDIPFEQAEALIGKARAKLKDVISGLDPKSDEMFDLMLSNEEALARMCNRALTGIDSAKGVTQSHQAMLPKMASGMRAEILASSPNRMKDDGTEITVNGKVFGLVEVIGEGANGAVRRYTDGDQTFVVKSLKKRGGDTDERFDKMADEMRTHRQLMTGADDGVSDATNIVEMQGAAVSNDGSLHMMMEEAEGGDMGAVGNNMAMLQTMGVLPDAARKVLALDMIAQTVKGMKAMQERGLVQNDLKPQNMMLNKDGTVKIIDFGESMFVDETTGIIPNAPDAGYNTTPGYEAPEHYDRGGTVDAKADAFALGGIIKVMLNPAMSEAAVGTDLKPVSAMGRLTKALTDDDPAKRPSLDAVLMSSLLDQSAADANPEDVKDLQKASAAVNVALKGVKAKVSAGDLKDNSPPGKYLDTMWAPHHEKGLREGAEIQITAFNTMVVKLEDYIRDTEKKLREGPPGEAMEAREAIDKAKAQRAFWMAEVNRQMEENRAEGRAEIAAAVNDEWNEMQVPGEDGGYLLLSDAVKLRDRQIAAIPAIQKAFYERALADPVGAQAAMDETNRTLALMDAQIQAVNAEILRLVGPKGRYVLAEAKLAEVAGRFGPSVKGATMPAEPAPDPLPPLPPEAQGVIPDPPKLPDDKRKVGT
ncbi:MAG: protein kinase family protein [Gemmobacter sp.]